MAQTYSHLAEAREKSRLFSTGPTSPEGKAIVRLNNVSTGRYLTVNSLPSCNMCWHRKSCEAFAADKDCQLKGQALRRILQENVGPIATLDKLAKDAWAKYESMEKIGDRRAVFWLEETRRILDTLLKYTDGEKLNIDNRNFTKEIHEMSRMIQKIETRNKEEAFKVTPPPKEDQASEAKDGI